MTPALVLRRAQVVQAEPGDGPEQRLEVERQDGSRHPAIVDVGLHGRAEVGDDVVVNAQRWTWARLRRHGHRPREFLTRGLEATGVPAPT